MFKKVIFFFKVRERLRTAQERIVVLEDELMLANQEVYPVGGREGMEREEGRKNRSLFGVLRISGLLLVFR